MELKDIERLFHKEYVVDEPAGGSTQYHIRFKLLKPGVTGPNLLLKERFILCDDATRDVLQVFDAYPTAHDVMTTMLRFNVTKVHIDKVFDLIDVVGVVMNTLLIFERTFSALPKDALLCPTLHYALCNSEAARRDLRIHSNGIETYRNIVIHNTRDDRSEYGIILRGW